MIDNKKRGDRETKQARIPCGNTDIYEEKGQVTFKAEIFLHAGECQGLLVNTSSYKGAKKDPPLEPSERVWSC